MRCVIVAWLRNGRSIIRWVTISPQHWHAEPAGTPEPDRIVWYRVEGFEAAESVCDRMLLRYVHDVPGQSEQAARRMLRRSWGCDVRRSAEALLLAEVRLWENERPKC